MFETIIKSVSTSNLIPQLSGKERWGLLLDTLRGMPPFRGGRTRDFPFSEQRDNACRLAGILCETLLTGTPGQNKETGTYNLFDYLSAVALVDTAIRNNKNKQQKFTEDYFTLAIIHLNDLVFDKEPDKLRASILLGIDSHTFRTNISKAKRNNAKLFSMAATLAVISNFNQSSKTDKHLTLDQITSYFEIHPTKIQTLRELTLATLHIKTRHVQKFLDGCLSHFILRGASFWCSQVLSITRDVICNDSLFGARLYTDCDSVVIILIDNDTDEKEVKKLIFDNLIDRSNSNAINKAIILKNYPRLARHYDQALSEGINLANVLPPLGVSINKQVSILDLATDRIEECPSLKSSWNEKNTLIFSKHKSIKPTNIKSAGYQDEETYIDTDYHSPSWYSQNQTDKVYGWSSTLYSLTDISFRQQFLIEIQSWLNKKLGYYPDYETFSKNIANTLGLGDNTSFIKIDGDNVGKHFTSHPSVCRPRLSICLEENIKYRCLHSIKTLIKKHSLKHIPLDLVYFGGDDLVFMIPSALENDFISAFVEENPANTVLDNNIKYSFASIQIKNVKYKDKTPNDDFLQTEMARFLNPFLNIAKEYYKNDLNCLSQIAVSELDDRGQYLLNKHMNDIRFVNNTVLHGLTLDLHDLCEFGQQQDF